MSFAVASLVLGGFGMVMGIGLALASKKFAVPVDPRVEAIVGNLPGANCAACGFAGCSAFARSVVEGKAKPAGCTAGGPAVAAKIAEVMGVEAALGGAVVAYIHCNGDLSEKRRKGDYRGIETCAGASLVAGGPFQCVHGCVGFNDCIRVCPFGAIEARENLPPMIIDEKCTGCGLCVAECPKKIISLLPLDEKLVVACSSKDKGKITRQVCDVGCIACGICAKKLPGGYIAITNQLAVIDYAALRNVDHATITDEALKACPTKCIFLKN